MEIIELKEYLPHYFEAIHKLCTQLLSDCNLSEEYLREIIESENTHLFLALEEETVLGMLSVGIYKTPTGVKAWIEDVVVDSQARGKGLGRKLMLHAIDFTKKGNVDTLMLTSRPSRITANKLYQSLGFEKRETNVYRMTTR